ncbi:hypothetical protein D3C78_1676190 [compost metagenome]
MMAMRLQKLRISERSWEMKKYVSPSSSLRRCNKAMTCFCTETSSAEVGSSSTMIFGSAASARAIATRCFCPPESSCGYFER